MIRISDYHHPSDDDVNLPRSFAIAHANICMIRHYNDKEATSANVTVASGVDEPGASVVDELVVTVLDVTVNVFNDMYQLCVQALINEASVSSLNSMTDNIGGIGPGF